MYIDNFGIVHENVVYIPDGSVLENCWKVRVLKRHTSGRYEVVGEELYPSKPNEDQIMWCIANYKGTQAVLEVVYWMEKIPFTEDEGGSNGDIQNNKYDFLD